MPHLDRDVVNDGVNSLQNELKREFAPYSINKGKEAKVTKDNKVYPDPGILYLIETTQCVTGAEYVKA